MPARARFVDAPHYYSTLFHELIHSTGPRNSTQSHLLGRILETMLYSKRRRHWSRQKWEPHSLCAIAGIANAENTERNTTAYVIQ